MPRKFKGETMYNRWQQRNRHIIHDVTRVKHNEENKIFLTLVDMFSKIKKSLKQKIKNT